MGVNGVIFFDNKGEKFYKADAFAMKSTDKVGAGDAMLSSFILRFQIKFKT